ncbi:MAG: hypothetical protein PHU98_10945 [Mariniphaga sp.]|nr:hypothetical protein [Mariniphaga sp.]
MTVINLGNLNGIPKKFLKELKKYDSLFYQEEFLENLLSEEPINDIVVRINEFCEDNIVIGFHYTRAIPEEITKMGLICRTGKEIRNTFMSNWGHLFTDEEKVKITNTWDSYFDMDSQENRDNILFFNFTTYALCNGGAERLLENFGGEQVYMPIESIKDIGEKIKSIGNPMILKCRLTPKDINTFYENPWGRIAVSTYHRLVNPEAHQDDQDGYQSVNVAPENIEIIKFRNDQCQY